MTTLPSSERSGPMAYREKLAWLTLVPMLIAYSLYFTLILIRPPADSPLQNLLLFGMIAGTLAIIVAVGNVWVTVQSKRESKRHTDQRDHRTERRGATIGYYVLMTGMIVVGVVMPFTETRTQIVNTALFMLVIAEAVRQSIVLMSYRRGWHG